MTSGGSVNVGALDLGPSCFGYATRPPDLRLFWSGNSLRGSIRILFQSDEGEDTILIVNSFSGDWLCNDDASGLDPAIDIPDPSGVSGRLELWVASYSSGEYVSGMLYITELDLDHGDLP